MSTLDERINQAAEEIIACFRAGGKLLLCGNGGSAADCAHICGELAKGFLKKRTPDEAFQQKIGEVWAKDLQMALPAIDLTANSALMCAIINDIDGKSVFAQQVMAYGRKDDVLLGISTSGNAENICRAMKTAHAMGMKTVALTGESGGRMKEYADILLNVAEKETYKIQELHLPLYHRLCILIEEAMF
ncbi:MAG: SIS domain-containing protein [Clostridiales bacterium]|nr:SIS domain-containing protein [Clostridiales bacterium]